jgi:medium-chain acyl-[acyl-carrier-protein] hydrolase
MLYAEQSRLRRKNNPVSLMSCDIPPANPWISRPRKRPEASFRLFCFPRAGGGVASFRSWPEDCHPEIEVALVQPPGRENRLREVPLHTMESLVSSVCDAMTELLDRPYALFGHSLGAKVAFETSRELRQRGLPEPVCFFAAASAGPAVPWTRPLLHSLGDLELLQEIQRRYGGVPQGILADRELWPFLVPALRADLTILETYRYAENPPLSCPITCFCGTGDAMTPESEAEEWRRQTSAKFRLHMLPGDHFFPLQERPRVLKQIATDLSLRDN